MINVQSGDTLIFQAHLTDLNGTAITNATGSLIVVDNTGSSVFNGTVNHISDGTHLRSISTASWGIGPIQEYWSFSNLSGTFSQSVFNKFRIIGTNTIDPYIHTHELFAYYENVDGYFDGSEEERVWDSYNFINQQLQALGYKLPVTKGDDGFYDQALRDWNAWDSIYRIIAPRAVSQTRDNEDKPWFDYYKKRSDEMWDRFLKKKVVLNKQTSPGEAGIQPGTKVAGTLYSRMETNWEGYGNGFKGADFPRTWRVEVLGTGTSGGLSEATFRWSMDNGVSWEGTSTTSVSWVPLTDEVYVRFHRGTYTGTTNIFSTADAWNFNTAPLKISSGGVRSAQSY